MVTEMQVRRLFVMQNKVKYLYQLADLAGMSTKTARKYLEAGKLPSQLRVEHTWKTHKDCFKEVWPQVEGFLDNEDTGARAFLKIFKGCIRADIRTASSAHSNAG